MIGIARIRISTGWVSEVLNPLSGMSGPILEPVAMTTSLRYKVILGGGAIVRGGVELASPVVRVVPCGQFVDVIERRWSDYPSSSCVRRFKLRDGTGWVSTVSTDGMGILELVGPSPSVSTSSQIDSDSVMRQETDTKSRGSSIPNSQARQCPEVVQLAQDVSTCIGDGQQADFLSPELKERLMCIVCMDQYKNAMLVHNEIGHIVTCIGCARILYARGDTCPICRLPISSVVQYAFS